MTEPKKINDRLAESAQWKIPSSWHRIFAIDMHTAGEPLRVFVSGYPELSGDSVLAKRGNAKKLHDQLRTATMWEPRGHADMYGCILSPATIEVADFDIVFLHNEGYSTMCGHAIIAITKLAVQLGLVKRQDPVTEVRINAPAGLVTSYAEFDADGKIENIYFDNVPSFVVALEEKIEVPDLGTVNYDLAYGGAFYAYVQAADLGLECTPEYYDRLIKKGMQIKNSVQKSGLVVHPFEEDLGFLYGTIFIGDALEGGDSRNVCIFAEGEVDRSPTGTGVSGRVAIDYSRGNLQLNETVEIESILGTKFTASVVKETEFGKRRAVIPRVGGMAYFTGRNELLIDPDDPLKHGFFFR